MAPKPGHRDIDQGWAWWVLFASYLNLLLCSGLSFVAGMFQVVFLQEFQGSVALTSWVTSLFSSFMQLGGPLSSLLANAFDCRTAVMVGGVCLASGLALSAFGQSLGALFVFFGIIAGLGLGLTYTASVVVISYFFHQRRTMVTGIALSSAGLGIMLAPQISTFLIQNFSWREALGLMGMASAHVCVLGALMFPVHEKKDTSPCSFCSQAFAACFIRKGRRFFTKFCPRGWNKTWFGGCRRKKRCYQNVVTTEPVTEGDTPCNRNKHHDGPFVVRNEEALENDIDKPKNEIDKLLSNAVCLQKSDQSESKINKNSNHHHICSNTHSPSKAELSPFSSSLETSSKGDNALPSAHSHQGLAKRTVATINDSTRSLKEHGRQGSPRHRYFLRHQHHHSHALKCSSSGRSHPSLHTAKAHPKSQSFFELSSSGNCNVDTHNDLNPMSIAFRSDRELYSARPSGNQGDSHSKASESESHVHSGVKRRPPLSSTSSHNFISIGDQKFKASSESFERCGTRYTTRQESSSHSGTGPAPKHSTSHLHVRVVPHSPSLLSLVASTHYLDVILHQNDHPSSKEQLLDKDHPLHKGLFGTSSGLAVSQSSLRSSTSPSHVPVGASINSEAPMLDARVNEKTTSSATPSNNVQTAEENPGRPLYKNAAFYLLCLQLFVANCACGVFNIHLPSFAMSKGLTEQEMTNILSFNGLALLNGRMMVGALASATGLDLLIYWALHILGGLFVILMPAVGTSYFSFCCLILAVGTFFGSVYSVLTSLTLKYVGLPCLATAFGAEMICAGLGYLLAPPVAGLLVDLTGSYDYDMYCGGGLLILSAVLLMFLPIMEPEVTREDLRGSLNRDDDNDDGAAGSSPHGGIKVDVEIEDCAECLDNNHDDHNTDCDDDYESGNNDDEDVEGRGSGQW